MVWCDAEWEMRRVASDVQWLFWKMIDFENHSVTSLLSPHPCFLKDCDYGVVVVVLLMKIE